MNTSPLHERLHAAVAGRSIRHVAELTRCNHESVRRYLSGQTPSVEFLTALCAALSLSAEWLLSGRGPMRAEDVRREALREAGAPDLLLALAHSVEQLTDRVERLERFIQTMETRLRAAEPAGPAHDHAPAVVISDGLAHLADVLPKRSPPAAR